MDLNNFLKVKAIKDFDGTGEDELQFKAGEEFTLKGKSDDSGFGEGELESGKVGFFPLDHVEILEEDVTEKTALDFFIEQAKTTGPTRKLSDHLFQKKKRYDSLAEFVATRPERRQMQDKEMELGHETVASVHAAERKLKKKKAKDSLDSFLKGRIGHKAESVQLDEEKVNKIVLVLAELPRGKQKHFFRTFEDVLTGQQIVSVLQKAKLCGNKEEAVKVGQALINRKCLIPVLGSKTFREKELYQLQCTNVSYGLLNGDKLWKGAPPADLYSLCIELLEKLSKFYLKYDGKIEKMKASPDFYQLSLELAELQQGDPATIITEQERLVFFINLHNLIMLYAHVRIAPPLNPAQRRHLRADCYFVVGQQRYSCEDIEEKILFRTDHFLPSDRRSKFEVKISDKEQRAQLLWTLSDGTMSWPATYIFRVEKFEQQIYNSAVHFLKDTVELRDGKNEIILPRRCQLLYTTFGIPKADVIEHIKRWLRPRIVKFLDEMNEIRGNTTEGMKTSEQVHYVGGHLFEVKYRGYSFNPCYIFEVESLEEKPVTATLRSLQTTARKEQGKPLNVAATIRPRLVNDKI